MTRKAAAKRSEANAAVLRRAAGLDQRFKMSASVAGFPSIYIAGVPELFLSLASAAGEHKVLQLLQIFIAACSELCFASMSTEQYFELLASPFTLPFESLQPQELRS